jgi:hypothetical protein
VHLPLPTLPHPRPTRLVADWFGLGRDVERQLVAIQGESGVLKRILSRGVDAKECHSYQRLSVIVKLPDRGRRQVLGLFPKCAKTGVR